MKWREKRGGRGSAPQLFEIFRRLDAHFLLKRSSKVLRILEPYTVGNITNPEGRILLRHSTCRFDTVVTDESRDIHSRYRP